MPLADHLKGFWTEPSLSLFELATVLILSVVRPLIK
jgi:hypothetical protein